MKDTLGIIITEKLDVDIQLLTIKQSMAMLPIAGKYRMIDFALSNMVNSGFTNIGVIAGGKYASLIRYLGTGDSWGLKSSNKSLAVFQSYPAKMIKKKVDATVVALNGIIDFIKTAEQEHIVVSSCDLLCNIDYRDVMDFHKQNNLDATLIHVNGNEANCDINMFIAKKHILVDIVEKCNENPKNKFATVVLNSDFKVSYYEHNGYARFINNLHSYYNVNMELLDLDIRKQLLNSEWSVYTNTDNTYASKYGQGAGVVNSMIADGCIIDGHVENSIIFENTVIEKHSSLKNCIILHNSHIEENCILSNVIKDNAVIINC